MKRSYRLMASALVGLTIIAATGLASPQRFVDEPKGWIGSWRQVSAKLGVQEKRAGEGQPEKLLHLTTTQFTRVVFERKTRRLLGIVGGHYTLEGPSYTEIIDYADEATRKTGKPDVEMKISFQGKLDGDRLELKMSAHGQDYVEVWERVK